MKTSLKLEELGQLILGIFLFAQLDYSWWWFPILLLAPDVGMFGYIINPKIGAVVYNLFHHKGIAILLGLLGFYSNSSMLILIAVILYSHASFDRIFGYGLKYPDSFKNTHLGGIGK